MNVLELYSGVGGMHLALQTSGKPGTVKLSVDINPTANLVYKHNFPNTPVLNRNIQGITAEYINKLNIDCILMSPPCQPFTRNGLQEDINDPRTESFIHILNILPELAVKYILIENVKGFETSQMRNKLLQVLKDSGFIYQEYILTPTQFGVPNTRHRYYCIAKKCPLVFVFRPGEITSCWPTELYSFYFRTISDVLEEGIDEQDYLLSDSTLLKRGKGLDICYPTSCRSCCFTKSYGRYVTGTGSVYSSVTKPELDSIYEELQTVLPDTMKFLNCIKRFNLRLFTPREVCRLMSFPDSFDFPLGITNKQKYMLLGNSINVRVVSELIKMLVS